MNLSAKQIAVFGQVKVDVRPIGSPFPKLVSLLEFYNRGYWVTSRFGSTITLVKRRKYSKDGFCCIYKKIQTDINLNTLDALIEPIARQQYLRYKDYLESKKPLQKSKIYI